MTSAITPGNIDVDFPVAGQDNDSQGFRDNFGSIYTALSAAKTEIEELQTKAILKAAITNGIQTNDSAFNNLNGNIIRNGGFKNFYPKKNPVTATGPTTIYAKDGEFQPVTVNGNYGLTVSWSEISNSTFSRVILQLVNGSNSVSYTPTLGSSSTIKYEHDFPSLELSIDGFSKVVEVWTPDGGTTVFARSLGTYSGASADRDIEGDLNVLYGTINANAIDVATLNVSGASEMTDVTLDSITARTGITVQGDLSNEGNATLGTSTTDHVNLNGIPILPQVSDTTRNALTPLAGMMVFNIDSFTVQIYNGTAWRIITTTAI